MSRPYVNAKWRVEQVLPVRLLFGWLSDMLEDEKRSNGAYKPENYEVLQALQRACHEPLADMEGKEAAKLARRIDRLAESILRGFNGHTAGKVWLMVIYFWHDLIEDGFCILVEGSDADKAFEAIKAAVIEEGSTELPKMEESAENDVQRVRARLESEGYYQHRRVEYRGRVKA